GLPAAGARAPAARSAARARADRMPAPARPARSGAAPRLVCGAYASVGLSSAQPSGARIVMEQPRHDEHDLLGDIDGVLADPLQAPRDQHHEHRPLAQLDVLAHLDRTPEDLPVETVDLGVLARQFPRQLEITAGERLLGLRHLRAGELAHPLD